MNFLSNLQKKLAGICRIRKTKDLKKNMALRQNGTKTIWHYVKTAFRNNIINTNKY